MIQQNRTKESIVQTYQQHIRTHESEIQKLKKTKRTISIARLLVVVTALPLTWYLWQGTLFYTVVVIILSIAIFFYLVVRDSDLLAAIKNNERLISVNHHELNALQYRVKEYDDGQVFADPEHMYASDLDLFGPSSLFQWLSRCHADQSKKKLAAYLKKPQRTSAVILAQEAVKELSEKQSWCQQFQARALADPMTDETEKSLRKFMNAPSAGYDHLSWKWFQNLYPLIPISVSILYATDEIPVNAFLSALTIFYFISVMLSKKIKPALEALLDIEPKMDSIYHQLSLIESETFRSTFLRSLQTKLKPADFSSASSAIRAFNSILKKNDWRSNLLVNMILQVFFVWDLRLITLLYEWKKKNFQPFSDWFSVITEMEVVISLASVAYNEPSWCFPKMDEHYFHFTADDLGHPLIPPDTRVTNDFSMQGTGKVALITGSNMAGKSTFLRSIGINTVLAVMGAPVCARSMSISHSQLISSMRVADNLAENTSTFYAELKKLKTIIELVNSGQPVFILLDEVLRGTNSDDRHKGSQALISQLLRSQAVSIMATHDTELAHSESGDKSVSNYHFEGRIVADELLFDYKIKNGICESLNATILMKKIGIHFED